MANDSLISILAMLMVSLRLNLGFSHRPIRTKDASLMRDETSLRIHDSSCHDSTTPRIMMT